MASEKVKVLFLGSNPAGTGRLALDEEIKAITRMIRASEHRDVLQLSSYWAVEPDDLLQALNEVKPAVVHFSGHGTPFGEIVLVDASGAQKPVSAEALKALFTALKHDIRVVVLNACGSKLQADAISDVIDCVVGMSTAVTDKAAITFAASFYRAIGFALSVKEAYEQARVSLLLQGIPEETTPELLERGGIDAASVVLVDARRDEGSLSGRGIRTPLDPAKVIEVQTEFFNRLTGALWKWRYMAMQVAFYGRQGDKGKLALVAQHYDQDVWSVFPEIRIEISRAQRYLSYDTCLQLRALYAFIVEFDKALSNLIFLPESESDQDLPPWQRDRFSDLNAQIYSLVTTRIEDTIASVAAELRLGFDE